jgi:hypothetical protein
MIRVFTIAASKAKTFFDTFNRANGSLQRSSDGSLWEMIRGSWGVVSNKASASDGASTYPLAAVPTASENVDISLRGVSQGSSAALWVTDSGNWFAVGIDQTSIDCNCGQCPIYNAESYFYYDCGDNYCQGNCAINVCNAWNYTCNVVGNRYCKTYNTNYCNKWFTSEGKSVCNGTWNAKNCSAYNKGNCNETYAQQHNCKTSSCQTYNYYKCGDNYCLGYTPPSIAYYYTCNCSTCYPQYVRVIKSVSNTVSELASFAVSSVINSFKILVRGSQITTKVYSGTDLTSQIDSDLVYTPTNVAINAKYGIMVKPSSYSQGSTIDQVEIENK